MYSTYYLFIDLNYPIEAIFNYLKSSTENGIKYTTIKNNIVLPKCIVVKSLYKDKYLKNMIKNQLLHFGYEKNFQIFKPLVKEYVLPLDNIF